MSKKISWLEKFAEDRAATLTKTASLNKKAAQVIVDCDDCPNAQVGQTVTYKNEQYKVVQNDFQDEMGAGVVLEKLADGEELEMPIEATAALEDVKKEDEEVPAEEEAAPAAEEELKEEELPTEEEAPAVEEAPAAAPEATPAPAAAPAAAPAPVAGPKKLTDAPERARNEVVDTSLHIEVRDTTEVQGFQSAAAETEQAIAQENSVDRTTVDGHYTWNQNRILDRMVSDLTGVQPPAPEAAPAAEEAAPVEEKPAEEAAPAAAPAAEEAPADEKKEKFASNRILKQIVSK